MPVMLPLAGPLVTLTLPGLRLPSRSESFASTSTVTGVSGGVAAASSLATGRALTMRLALAELLPPFGSGWAAEAMSAVFEMLLPPVPGLTVALMVSVAEPPDPTLPTAHMPDPLSYVPWLAAAPLNVRPPGSRSETTTPLAPSGPLFVNMTV